MQHIKRSISIQPCFFSTLYLTFSFFQKIENIQFFFQFILLLFNYNYNLSSIMLSPQTKLYCSSPNTRTLHSKIKLIAKTNSSSPIRSEEEDQQERRQLSSYSKLLKQKDIKIITLLENQRSNQAELTNYRKTQSALQSDLSFFKQKLQLELQRNFCLQSHLQLINDSMKSIMLRIFSILQGNQMPFSSFANYLQQAKDNATEFSLLDVSNKILSGLQLWVTELCKQLSLLRKDHECQKMTDRSTGSILDCHKITEQLEKKALRGQLNDLLMLYETRAIDSLEYKQEIYDLRTQRQYIKRLLISSQREKNFSANEAYELAKRDYKINFEEMSKSEVVKLCMSLLSKLKDLNEERCELQEKIQSLQVTEKSNYNQMLRTVKEMQKKIEKKPTLKRMTSMPYN